jgi:hypothetical protein
MDTSTLYSHKGDLEKFDRIYVGLSEYNKILKQKNRNINIDKILNNQI